jgi:peptide deformylase
MSYDPITDGPDRASATAAPVSPIIRRIVRMGDPVLLRVADPIVDPTTPEIRALAEQMAATMHAAPGVGLAAPQIGLSTRIIVFIVPEHRTTGHPGDRAEALNVLINPEITPLDDEIVLGWEGCLSIPGLKGEVPRHGRIGYRGLDLEGRLVEREATGFHARVVQHEVDHLNGILYPSRMTNLAKLGYNAEIDAALMAEQEPT